MALTLALVLAGLAPTSARANVYASNVRLNGTTTNLSLPSGGTVTISYILNEPATAGVTVKVLAGTNAVRTIAIPTGQPGTLLGTNTVLWDGRDDASNAVSGSALSINMTAAATGYPVWTQITSDDHTNSRVWEGRGIAVVQNPNSPYYGRIFVANSAPGLGDFPGYEVGLLKVNADLSPAEDGVFSTGGFPWLGNGFSPWKLEVSADDYLYVSDATSRGEVYRWDLKLSSASRLDILRPDNWGTNADGTFVLLNGPALVGTGTNTQIWMGDTLAGLGLIKYAVDTNGACATNDFGVSVVTTPGGDDVALDPFGNVYTIHATDTPGDLAARVFCYPPYDPSTNGGLPLATPTWSVGSGDNTLGQTTGIAVDPTGTYLAVSSRGLDLPAGLTNGCTQIFYASNGALVTNLDLGVVMHNDPTHSDMDCTWDAAGNVYYIDNEIGYWRAVSPPGPNQSTTPAFQTVQIAALAPPVITFVQITSTNVLIKFAADPTDVPGNFVILGASQVGGPYSFIYGAVLAADAGPGTFTATFPPNGTLFFRIARAAYLPPAPPKIARIALADGTVNLTVFGWPTDTTNSLAVLASPAVAGAYSQLTSVTNTVPSPGIFQISFPSADPGQFYRIRR